MTWSNEMEKIAKDWAKHLAEKNLFKHSSKRPGNLFMAPYKPREYCTEALKWMYTEEKLYNYDKPGYQPRAGHFTQVSIKSKNSETSFHPSLRTSSPFSLPSHFPSPLRPFLIFSFLFLASLLLPFFAFFPDSHSSFLTTFLPASSSLPSFLYSSTLFIPSTPSLSPLSLVSCHVVMFILFFLCPDNLEKHEKDWRSVGISQGRQIGGRYQVRSHGKLCQRQSFQSERFPAEG